MAGSSTHFSFRLLFTWYLYLDKVTYDVGLTSYISPCSALCFSFSWVEVQILGSTDFFYLKVVNSGGNSCFSFYPGQIDSFHKCVGFADPSWPVKMKASCNSFVSASWVETRAGCHGACHIIWSATFSLRQSFSFVFLFFPLNWDPWTVVF